MKTNAILVLILVLVFTNGYGQFKYTPNALVPFDPAFKNGKLANGIHYMIRSNPVNKGKAYFYAFFNVGSNQEKPNEYGAAHFIEHLYGDYPNYEANIKDYLESIGLSFGADLNAGTSEERTQYTIFNVPTQREQTLDSVLLILKDIPFHSVSTEVVEKQRKIVMEEWRSRSGTDLSSVIKKVGFLGTSQTMHETIGDTAVISHITADQLKYFHDKLYRPDNLTVIAIGDFDALKMEARIKRVFSPILKAEGKSPRVKYLLADIKDPIIGITKTDQNESSVEITYKHEPQTYTQKRLRAEMEDLLINKMFNRRVEQIAEKPDSPLNSASASYINSYMNFPLYDSYQITFQPRNNDISNALNTILTEKERIEKYGFTGSELMQEEKEMIHNYMSQKGRKVRLPYNEYFIKCYYYLLNGKVSPSFDYFCNFMQKVVPTITLKDVNERFKEYTAHLQPTVNILIPNKKESTAPTSQEIKTILTSTETRTLTPYVAPKIITELADKDIHPGHVVKEVTNKKLGTTEWTLSNGMRVIIKTTNFDLDEIQFKGIRKDLSLKLKNEYSSLMSHGKEFYSDMGFGDYSNMALNQFIKTKRLSVNKDFQDISGYTAPKDLKTCLQLIRLKYLNQRWNEPAYNNRIKRIQEEFKDPEYSKVLWDTLAPYVWSESRSHKLITMNQLKQIHQTIFGNPAEFTFIFAGNINTEKAKPLIERYLASIAPDNSQEGVSVNDTVLYNKEIQKKKEWRNLGKIYKEFKYPMSGQGAKIEICYKCHADSAMLNDSNCGIVCSSLVFYLNNVLREKEHVTYCLASCWSSPDSLTNSVGFGCSFETNPQTLQRTNMVAENAVRNFIKNGLEENDFKSHKTGLTSYRLHDLNSNWWWAEIALPEYYQRGKDIVSTYLSDVKDMTKESLAKLTRLCADGYLVEVAMLPE